MEKIEIEKIQRLVISPGGTLVVTLPQGTNQDLGRVAATLKERLPEGVNTLIISGDIQLSVVTTEDAA